MDTQSTFEMKLLLATLGLLSVTLLATTADAYYIGVQMGTVCDSYFASFSNFENGVGCRSAKLSSAANTLRFSVTCASQTTTSSATVRFYSTSDTACSGTVTATRQAVSRTCLDLTDLAGASTKIRIDCSYPIGVAFYDYADSTCGGSQQNAVSTNGNCWKLPGTNYWATLQCDENPDPDQAALQFFSSSTCSASSSLGFTVSDAVAKCTYMQSSADSLSLRYKAYCNSAIPVSYIWQSGSWGTCSVTCGGGTQSRSVTCMGSDGQSYPDYQCAGTKPDATQTCNSFACPTYSWQASSWGSCSQTCGGGTQTRTVSCMSSYGGSVLDSYCDANSKPGATQSCNTALCPSYSWRVGNWSACGASCGGGYRTRTVNCVDVTTSTTASDYQCAASRPQASESCNTQSCSDPSAAGSGGSASGAGGSSSGSNGGMIGGIVGAIVGAVVLGVGVFFGIRWCRQRSAGANAKYLDMEGVGVTPAAAAGTAPPAQVATSTQ